MHVAAPLGILALIAVGSFLLGGGPPWEGPFVMGEFPIYIRTVSPSEREYKVLLPGSDTIIYHYSINDKTGVRTIHHKSADLALIDRVKKALGIA